MTSGQETERSILTTQEPVQKEKDVTEITLLLLVFTSQCYA